MPEIPKKANLKVLHPQNPNSNLNPYKKEVNPPKKNQDVKS